MCVRQDGAEKIQAYTGQAESCVWARSARRALCGSDQGEGPSKATRGGNDGELPTAEIAGGLIIFGQESLIRRRLSGGDEPSCQTNLRGGLDVFRWDLLSSKLYAYAGVGGRTGLIKRRIPSRIINIMPSRENYVNRLRPVEEFANRVIRR